MRDIARALRKQQTTAELALWQALRRGQLDGLRFRKQHAVVGMVVDFYCPAHHLVIEVDGGVHDEPEQQQRDADKDEFLIALGNTVLRLRNEEVLHHLPAALARIRAAANRGPLSPNLFPLPEGQGGM